MPSPLSTKKNNATLAMVRKSLEGKIFMRQTVTTWCLTPVKTRLRDYESDESIAILWFCLCSVTSRTIIRKPVGLPRESFLRTTDCSQKKDPSVGQRQW